MRVYRYYHAKWGLAALKDLQIRTSDPKSLNDPFELSPKADPKPFTQQDAEYFLRQAGEIDDWYRKEGRTLGFTNKKDYKRWYLKEVPKRAAILLPNVPNNAEQVRKNFAADFSRIWRIICASKRHDSTLMWSHYAENHAGIVIELDLAQEPLLALARDGFARSIIYAKDKPILRYNPVEAKFREMYLAAASTKAPDWDYEQEIRVFVPNSPQVLSPDYLLSITAMCVRNVFLGARASFATKAEVYRLLGQASFAHARLFQGQLSDAEYALVFVPVP